MAWQDYSDGDNEIYVRLWNGNTWQEVGSGSASGGGISNNNTGSSHVAIAIAPDGTPYVVWSETDYSDGSQEDAEIFVRRWNGTQWQEVGPGSASGGGISNNNTHDGNPSIGMAPDGTPYIAWSGSGVGNSEIYVRRWNGMVWEEVGSGSAIGGGISDDPTSSNGPAVAIDSDGAVFVTWENWTYDTAADSEIYIRRWSGSSWQEVGSGSATAGGVSDNASESTAPDVVIAPDGTPYITWFDDEKGLDIFIKRWNGQSWEQVGDGSASGTGVSDNEYASQFPAIAVAPDGLVYLSWFEVSDDFTYKGIYVRKWTKDVDVVKDVDVRIISNFKYHDDDRESGFHPSLMTVAICVENVGRMAVDGWVSLEADGRLIGSKARFPEAQEGKLASGEATCVELLWDLGQKNGSRAATLRATAELNGQADQDPADNVSEEQVNVYWSDFAHNRDAYHFENEGYEIIDFWADLLDLLPYFRDEAQLGMVFAHYFWYVSEWDGHCFGMAATSVIYNQSKDLRPVGYPTTFSMDEGAAWPAIRKYQRNQFIVLPESLVDTLPNWLNDYDAEAEFDKAVKILSRNPAKPAGIALKGNTDHAVVAYKVMSTPFKKLFFFYDNKLPYKDIPDGGSPLLAALYNSGIFYSPAHSGSGVDHFYSYDIIPMADRQVANIAINMSHRWLLDQNRITIFTGSPVEPIVMDSAGHKLGIKNGTTYREIPGGNFSRLDGQFVFDLPAAGDYTFHALGTAAGDMTLAYAAPESFGSLIEVVFKDVEIASEGHYSTSISRNSDDVAPIQLPGGRTQAPDDVTIVTNIRNGVFLPLTVGKS